MRSREYFSEKSTPGFAQDGRVFVTAAQMPRRPCAGTAGVVFHVLNRGVRRMTLFESPTDYYAFLALLARAQRRVPVSLLSYCLMPNHFHLVLLPEGDRDLSSFMFWLTMLHSLRWHALHGTRGTGPVYQGRFKALPVQTDSHFLRLCRYVERNPLRANLVTRAEAWPWSSLSQRLGLRRPVRLSPWPVEIPHDWTVLVNADRGESETHEIRQAVRRSVPYGSEGWREQMGTTLGLTGRIRPMGRPKAKPGVLF
jgi:putative transposase